MAHSTYLTYVDYQALGGTLPQTAFTSAEFKSRKRIDCVTDSRVQNMDAVPDAVKLCMMSLIAIDNAAGVETQAEKPVVTSFSTDGYSESYGKAMSADDAVHSMNAIIKDYLFGEVDDDGVPLLFRGVISY